MIPLSNKFPKDYHNILLGVPIDGEFRSMINLVVRRPAISQCDFSDEYLFVEIENYLNHLYDPHWRQSK